VGMLWLSSWMRRLGWAGLGWAGLGWWWVGGLDGRGMYGWDWNWG